jgi:hypothetical protein
MLIFGSLLSLSTFLSFPFRTPLSAKPNRFAPIGTRYSTTVADLAGFDRLSL